MRPATMNSAEEWHCSIRMTSLNRCRLESSPNSKREGCTMGLFIDDSSVMNGLLMIVGIVGAFVLAVYSLTLPPPPMTTPVDRHTEEKAKQIYTRHDLWKW
jgi:hypothetical protein